MNLNQVIVREMGYAVQAVSDKLTGYEDGDTSRPRTLTAYKGDIQNVAYHYGHPIEIRETLQSWGMAPTYRQGKYPCVLLMEDIVVTQGGPYAIARLNLIIATATRPNYKSHQRQEVSFDPVLYPIYDELMRQIRRRGLFVVVNPRSDMPHDKIDRKYWGREIVGGTDANKLADHLDAIEIRDLRLKLSNQKCKPC